MSQIYKTTSSGTFTGSPTTFQAYLTSPQSIVGGSLSANIIFNSVINNVGGSYNNSTGIFTAPATGFYCFSNTTYFHLVNSLVGNTEVILGYTGNVQSLRLTTVGAGVYVSGDYISTCSWSMPMTSGDTVKIQPFADGTGNYQIFGAGLSSGVFNTSSSFSGFRVS